VNILRHLVLGLLFIFIGLPICLFLALPILCLNGWKWYWDFICAMYYLEYTVRHEH